MIKWAFFVRLNLMAKQTAWAAASHSSLQVNDR